jgi:hypothetical protein
MIETWEEEQMSNLGCESVSDLIVEVKRLHGLLMKGSEGYTTSYMDLRNIIENVHWELTGDDHESNEERIRYALGILSEVIE